MRRSSMICLLPLYAAIAFSQSGTPTPLRTVESLDLIRYSGTWYEIARLPNRFQNQCVGDVTATYTVLENGDIRVVNRCRKEDGEFTQAEGRARRASSDGPASQLEVRFAPAWMSFLPFVWGDYWILDLAPDYTYAVVGDPDRKYLWILARSTALDQETVDTLVDIARLQGYDTAALMFTAHSHQHQH
jgi:apolipoprotein D and lipocalin family protein